VTIRKIIVLIKTSRSNKDIFLIFYLIIVTLLNFSAQVIVELFSV